MKEAETVHDSPKARRIKCFVFDPGILMVMATEKTYIRIISGIPPGSQFRGFTVDWERNCLNVFVEHGSFPLVPVNEVCERHTVHLRDARGPEVEVLMRLMGAEKDNESETRI